MSKLSLPEPDLHQWPPLAHVIFCTIVLLFYIPMAIFVMAYFFLGPGIVAQPFEIEISFQSIVLLISMMVPHIISIVCGYRANNIEVPKWPGEEWAACLESAFKTLAQTARFPFVFQYPVPARNEELARYARVNFVQYLANQYDTNRYLESLFTRRRHLSVIVTSQVVAVCLAGIPFRNWSKHDDIMIGGGETLVQGLGCFLVLLWCHLHWEPMWKIGWVLKMGSIARQIRRECIKNSSEKGSGENTEQFEIIVDPEERLEWWIQESLKGCRAARDNGDGDEDDESDFHQMGEDCEKLSGY